MSYRVSKVISNCLGAEELDPTSPKALYLRGFALFEKGDVASAKTALLRAKENAPSDKKVAKMLTKVWETRGIYIFCRSWPGVCSSC